MANDASKPVAHFVHISKAGGTAVKFAIADHLETGAYSIKPHKHATTMADLPRGEKVFFVLRDPKARFVSGFYSRQRQGRPRYFVAWTPQEKAAFARFSTPGEVAEALSSPDRKRREQAEEAMNAMGHARRTFAHFLGEEEEIRQRADDILFVGFQEQLTQDFEILKSLLGLPVEVALPTGDDEAHRNPSTLDRRLSPQAVANLEAWYEKDYRILEFCRQLRAERDQSASAAAE